MKLESFAEAADNAVRAVDERFRLIARGILYGVGTEGSLLVGVYQGEDNLTYTLAAATPDPGDGRLHVVSVRHDQHTPRGFLGATNTQKVYNPEEKKYEDAYLLVPKDTDVFVPNDPSRPVSIGGGPLNPL